MVNRIEDFPLILLAGGKSARMGTPKGLLDYHGRAWLLEQLSRYKKAFGQRAIVVLGFHREHYFEKISWLRTAEQQPVLQHGLEVSVVVNPTPGVGQFSSLQCAISILFDRYTGSKKYPLSLSPTIPLGGGRAGAGIPGAFVLPVDVPGPGKEVYEGLTKVFGKPIEAVIPRYQFKGGHPVLLSREFLGRLSAVSPTSSGARLDLQIRALPRKRVAFVPVDDEKVSLNMNIMDEFRDFLLKG